MSRSRKKVPIYKDQATRKYGKKQANKAVRRRKEESFKGKEYRKVYSSWDISDYISYYSKEQAIKDWYQEENLPKYRQSLHNRYKTIEKWLLHWKKWNFNK